MLGRAPADKIEAAGRRRPSCVATDAGHNARRNACWEDEMRLLTSLGIAALAVGLGAAAQAETVKVGIMLPFSGVNADLGDAQKKAFDLYLKLHAKDVAPHKVEVVERDEGPPSGANAKTVETELITRDKVQ